MSRRLYVELDGLLDTRLATLILLDETQALAALDAGYRERVSDEWARLGLGLPQDQYEKRYRQRDVNTLKAARPTGAIPMINRMVHAFGEMATKTPFTEKVTLDVNFWPYSVSEDVRVEILSAVKLMIGTEVEVDSVHLAPEQLNPELIDRSWDGVVMYDFNQWLGLHEGALRKHPIVSIPFMVPMLYANRVPAEGETEIEELGEVSPFAALEMVLSEYVMLHVMDVKYFSFVDVQ